MLRAFRSTWFGSAMILAAAVLLTPNDRVAAHPPQHRPAPPIIHRPPVMNMSPRPFFVHRPTIQSPRPFFMPRPNPAPRPPLPLPMTPRPANTTRPTTATQPATFQRPAQPSSRPNPRIPQPGRPGFLRNGLANPGLGYPGLGYPGLGYPGTSAGGPGGILNTLANMLPGQPGYTQQTPGMSPTGRFFMYDNVTGSGLLSGSLPIVNQFAGVAGINYGGYGAVGPNPNFSLLPPGVALNVAYNTLPGIPMTQAPMNYGFGPFGFNNPYLMNPFGMYPIGYNPYLTNPYVGMVNPLGTLNLANAPFKGLGNGGYGL